MSETPGICDNCGTPFAPASVVCESCGADRPDDATDHGAAKLTGSLSGPEGTGAPSDTTSERVRASDVNRVLGPDSPKFSASSRRRESRPAWLATPAETRQDEQPHAMPAGFADPMARSPQRAGVDDDPTSDSPESAGATTAATETADEGGTAPVLSTPSAGETSLRLNVGRRVGEATRPSFFDLGAPSPAAPEDHPPDEDTHVFDPPPPPDAVVAGADTDPPPDLPPSAGRALIDAVPDLGAPAMGSGASPPPEFTAPSLPQRPSSSPASPTDTGDPDVVKLTDDLAPTPSAAVTSSEPVGPVPADPAHVPADPAHVPADPAHVDPAHVVVPTGPTQADLRHFDAAIRCGTLRFDSYSDHLWLELTATGHPIFPTDEHLALRAAGSCSASLPAVLLGDLAVPVETLQPLGAGLGSIIAVTTGRLVVLIHTGQTALGALQHSDPWRVAFMIDLAAIGRVVLRRERRPMGRWRDLGVELRGRGGSPFTIVVAPTHDLGTSFQTDPGTWTELSARTMYEQLVQITVTCQRYRLGGSTPWLDAAAAGQYRTDDTDLVATLAD